MDVNNELMVGCVKAATLCSFAASFRLDSMWGSVGPIEFLCKVHSIAILLIVGYRFFC